MTSIFSREQSSIIRILLLFIIVLFPILIVAQDVGGIDFYNLKSDDLSDQQITQLLQRMEAQGLTVSEVEVFARARGMSPSEINKLKSRLSQIESLRAGAQNNTSDKTRLRSLSTQIENSQNEPVDTLALFLEPTKSQVFGSDIFANNRITFEPSLNVPTPKNYALGPGDELIIDIWGAAENTYQLTISPEGSVTIPNLGPIFINGLTIEEASNRLIDKLGTIYSGLRGNNKNTYAQITLGNVRSIQVNIVGEVNTPGTFTLTSFSSVFNALYAAGGPNEGGTYRSIKLIRDGREIRNIDLYDFLVSGSSKDNITLQDQDIIKVDPYINRVTIVGEARRTGFFETKEGETFQDLLNFSGGFSENAYTKRLTVERNTATEKSIIDIYYPENKGEVLKNGDYITVGKILDRYANRVQIEGAIFRPGDYQLDTNPTLLTLINNAEGPKGDAYLDRAIIYRTRPDYSTEAIAVNLNEVLNNPTDKDVKLVKDDRIKISSIFDLREERTISISGSVISPDTYEYVENITLKDLIFEANGFTEDAAPYNIEIARRITDDQSGSIKNVISEIIPVNIEDGLNYNSQLDKIILMPFDQVFVRKSPTYEAQKVVTIKGEVLYPGTYTLHTRDFRLADLIDKSGGVNDYAFVEGASLEREFEINQKELELNLADSLTEEAEQIESLSKVGINLKEALQNPNSSSNILLLEGDVITIPKKLETVQVRGEVLYPINVRYNDGNKFKHYVNSAGGYTDQANKKKAYVVYANGDVDRTKKFLFIKSYPKVRPGSVLIIPPKEEKIQLTTAERITLYSTIVSLAAIVTNTIFQIRNSK
ncbi:MAG: SLBB domain-containing protein [Balneolaceae bacterium]|nr:SLBB domain-containing protein [Balneolaceae bacterium]MBO6546922.1 SLBB domain-containing protein [Balneolaceae bacterium]MBO6649282.1 SLBB domain-containing protein [Balneolaceae bacterium]